MASKTCCRNMQDRIAARGMPALITCRAVNTESPKWRKGPISKPVLCNACATRFTQGTLSKVSTITCSAFNAFTWLLHSIHSVKGLLQVAGSQPGVNVKCSQTWHTYVLLRALNCPLLTLVSSQQHWVNTLRCFTFDLI